MNETDVMKTKKDLKPSFRMLLFALGCIAYSSCQEIKPLENCEGEAAVAQSADPAIIEMREAMIEFRSSLSPHLLQRASSCLGSDRLRQWSNLPLPISRRNGLVYGELTPEQFEKFQVLLRLFLSQAGYQKVTEITTLAEAFLNRIDDKWWNPNLYSVDMFGDPEQNGAWGFQLDGHHCAISFLVNGDEISIVPAFLGGEPVTGNFDGVDFDIFQDERDLALNLYQGFSAEEQSVAVRSGSSATMEVGPAANSTIPDPFAGNYDYAQYATGLKYSEMSSTTQANLIALMREYVYNVNTTFADRWWQDILENIDETYLVWLDEVDSPNVTSLFYYRIYNPYLWVEFNMEPAVGNGIESWNHVHTITRIPDNPGTRLGGDYQNFALLINKNGPRTLVEHYREASHHKMLNTSDPTRFQRFKERRGGV